ncbi:Ger(x)C family spore germination protein [Natronospora cellulosivora (SeqCode)]
MKKVILIIMIVLISILNTACWDLEDIDTRAIVIAIAIDFEEPIHESPYEHTEMIRLTAQIALQQQLGGGAVEPSAMGEGSVWNVSVVGRNVSMALMLLEQRLQHDLFLGHIRMLVLSEDIAREGVNRHLNFFRNNPEFRRLSFVLIAKNSAEDILNTYPANATIQGIWLRDFVEDEVRRGNIPDVPFYEFVVRLVDQGIDPVSILVDRDKEIIRFAGLAVFEGERMIGQLNIEETWSYVQLSEKKTGGIEIVTDVKTELGNVAIEYESISTSLRPRINDDGSITFLLDMFMEANILSQEITSDYSNPIFFNQLEDRVSNELKSEIEVMFFKVQNRFQVDIFGMGKMVRAYYPRKWREIDDWRAEFQNVSLEPRVHVDLRRIGMSRFMQ